MDTTGGVIIAQMLRQEGVETFFRIVDGSYTRLFAHCVELGMEMITPRHEAVAEQRCAVIHVDVDPTAHMFAPGLQYFKDMHQEPAG